MTVAINYTRSMEIHQELKDARASIQQSGAIITRLEAKAVTLEKALSSIGSWEHLTEDKGIQLMTEASPLKAP